MFHTLSSHKPRSFQDTSLAQRGVLTWDRSPTSATDLCQEDGYWNSTWLSHVHYCLYLKRPRGASNAGSPTKCSNEKQTVGLGRRRSEGKDHEGVNRECV